MRRTSRKVGNSRGVIIPAALPAECQIGGPVEMTVENSRLVIEPGKASREGWFEGYEAARDEDAWEGLPVGADTEDREW